MTSCRPDTAPRVPVQGQRTIPCELASVNLPHWPLLEHLGFSPGIWRDTDGPIIFKYASFVSEHSGTDPGTEQCAITYHVTCSPFSHKAELLDPFAFCLIEPPTPPPLPPRSLPPHKGKSLFSIIARYKWKWGNFISDQVNKLNTIPRPASNKGSCEMTDYPL